MKSNLIWKSFLSLELADFGLAIEVIGEQTQWYGMYYDRNIDQLDRNRFNLFHRFCWNSRLSES
jgi:hypothetical protein